MKEKLFQQINLKRINFTTPNWRGSCFQSTATPIFKFLLMPQIPPLQPFSSLNRIYT